MKQNEIDFMKFMEANVLPNRRNIGYETLVTAGNFVGIPINTGCRSCAQKGGVDLLNRYGALKQAWIEYNKMELNKPVEVFTQYEASQVEPDIVITPVLPDEEEPVIGNLTVVPSEEFHPIEQLPKTFPKKKGKK